MSVRKILMKSSATKTTSTSELKSELLKWICERHATNGPLDRKLLRDRAMELATSFGIIGFKCSEAWLTVFLKKHGFSPSLTNCNGPIFTDYRIWIDLLRSLITQYRHKDLFNVDELVMYSDFLPTRKHPSVQSQQHHGDVLPRNNEISRISSQTKRIGILLCCNSTGTEKLEPLISNPYIMEQSHDDTGQYRREVSCIDDETFAIWLEKFNAEMSSSRRNVLLLLSRERIRSLKNFQRLSNVKLVFLPKNFPTQLRPLRGDIYHSVKMTYRRRYVEYILRREETREWTTKDIVEGIFEAWKDVPQELIVSSFQRTKFREDESFLKIHCPGWDSLETGMSFRKFVTFDDELSDRCDRANEGDAIFLNCAGNEHRYNLRRSRRETIDLGDRREMFNEKSQRARRIMMESTVNVNEIPHEADFNENFSSNEQESLRVNEIRDARGESGEFQNSRISELSDHTSVHKQPEILTHPVTTEICKIYENPEKRRILMDRCLHGMKFSNTELGPEVSMKNQDEIHEFDGDSLVRNATDVDDDEKERFTMGNKKFEIFPAKAGPSGREIYDSRETSGDVKSSNPMEFDDEEKIREDGELRLKILDAIEICENIEERDNDENLADASDLGGESSKRSRTRSAIDDINDDDDEPTNKRARNDGNWSKCYETNFVFGPEINENTMENNPRSSTSDDRTNGESSTSDRSKISQAGNDEIEKRCIFTLEASSNLSSLSYPKKND